MTNPESGSRCISESDRNTNVAMQHTILLVDDNPQYRAAVCRNLALAGYRVAEAEDGDEALEKVATERPSLVITDLDMRTHDEGLHLIKDLKRLYPALPVILISAVGTFDEGALARQYGAMYVLSKSKIEEEIDSLYERLERCCKHQEKIAQFRRVIEDSNGNGQIDAVQSQLNRMLADQELDAGFKSEVFELLALVEESRPAEPAPTVDLTAGRAKIGEYLPELAKFDKETQRMLSLAIQMEDSEAEGGLSVSRNVCFSYAFAVENEVKLRVGRRVSRLLSQSDTKKLLTALYDERIDNLDIFFNQFLIRTTQQFSLDLNSDITRQILQRMLRHGPKYKPDGLKALGVIVFCFGRQFELRTARGPIKVKNPLHLKGLEDRDIMEFSGKLIRLQHLRNPFIHPEFSEREKTASIRETAVECLKYAAHLV